MSTTCNLLFQSIDLYNDFKFNFDDFESQFDLEFQDKNFTQKDNTFFDPQYTLKNISVKPPVLADPSDFLLENYEVSSQRTKDSYADDADT